MGYKVWSACFTIIAKFHKLGRRPRAEGDRLKNGGGIESVLCHESETGGHFDGKQI